MGEDKGGECVICQRFHRPQPSEEMGSSQEPSRLGEVVGFDFLGPFFIRGARGKCWVLVMID